MTAVRMGSTSIRGLALVAVAILIAACAGISNEPSLPPQVSTTSMAGDEDAAAVSTSSSTSMPTTTSTKTTEPSPAVAISWERCGAIECGSLEVPLDYGIVGNSATIDIAVARRRASTPPLRKGVLIVNPGGPGASGIGMVRRGLGETINKVFDIVSWDQRGIGDSQQLDCDSHEDEYRELDWSPDTPDERSALDATAKSIADECASAAGPLLEHLSTDDGAKDMDRIRASLNEETISFLGFSYGTYLGLRYADLFPSHIRAMVLDGVVDPNLDLEGLLRGQATGLDSYLDAAFADCDSDKTCPLDDASATYDRVSASVEQRPIAAGSRTVGPATLAYAAFAASYSTSAAPNLLKGLAEADRGDGTALRALADQYWSSAPYASYLAVVCADSPHAVGATDYRAFADRLKQVSPRFGEAVANELLPCAFWRAPTTGRIGPVTARGSPPILVVGNTGDVATPHAAAETVASQLENGVLLTHHGTGHTSYYASTCVSGIVSAYLIDQTVPSTGAEC